MTQTSMRYADFVSRANRAHLHILVNNQWTPALKRDADAQAPAGGASSNVRDLVQWLILELADGQFGGKQLISQQALNLARTPQAVRGKNSETGLPDHYGFGWVLYYLPDNVFCMAHSGAFTLGAGTNVTLLPSEQLGIIALGNAYPTGVPEAVAGSLLDLARYGHVTKDWFAVYKNQFDESFTVPRKRQIEKYANPPVPNVPALHFAAYTGTYRNNYVGKVEITAANGTLYATRCWASSSSVAALGRQYVSCLPRSGESGIARSRRVHDRTGRASLPSDARRTQWQRSRNRNRHSSQS